MCVAPLRGCVSFVIPSIFFVVACGCGQQPTDKVSESSAEERTNDKPKYVGLFEDVADRSDELARPTGLPGEMSSIAVDHNGVVWLGSPHSGVYRFVDDDLRRFGNFNTTLPDMGIRSIFVDRDNVKWFCSRRGHLYSYDDRRSEKSRWKVHPIDESSELDDDTRLHETSLVEAQQHHDGSIVVATENGYVLRVEMGMLVQHTDRLKDSNAFDIDRQGRIWVGTSRGVFRWDGEHWTNVDDQGVLDILCDHQTRAVLAANALGVFRYQGGKMDVLNEGKIGLPRSLTTFVRGDRKRPFVIAQSNSPNGIALFDGRHWKVHDSGTHFDDKKIVDASIDGDRIWAVTRNG